MNTKLQGTQRFYKFLLRQIDEGRLTVSEAVDLVSDIDPETHLGRALNELLIKVSNFNLLDNYLGYEREARIVQAFFSQNTRYDKLVALAEQMTAQGEMSTEVPYAVTAEVFKKPTPDAQEKYQWVVKLVLVGNGDTDVEGPELASIEGEVVPGETEPKPGESEDV
jgi:hypothetical protein